MACLSENNVDTKHAEKLQKYQQLAFDIRQTARVQCNDNPNRYWLFRWRSDKQNWTTDIRREENKGGIEGNGEDSTI